MGWRESIARPLPASVLCSVMALPARLPGEEAARAFRRLLDWAFSRSDLLFDLVARSGTAAEAVRSGRAWSAWIVYGLVTGLAAMLATRWLAGRALPWMSIAIVLGLWIGVRLLVWNWDGSLQFALTEFRLDGPPVVWGPWPYAGSIGFLCGFAVGLVLAATPWRVSPLPVGERT
jgi:hypothetical protein